MIRFDLPDVPAEFDEDAALEEHISYAASTTKKKKSSGFRGRGLDFKARLLPGQWSEDKLVEAIDRTSDFACIRYGASEIGPEDATDLRDHFAMFEETETHGKRPDLLVYDKAVLDQLREDSRVETVLEDFTRVPDRVADPIAQRALFAIECENSLWRAKAMRKFDNPTKYTSGPIAGQQGFPKSAIIPRLWIKQQDLGPLCVWYRDFNKKPLYVIQIFFDLAYALGFRRALYYISSKIVPEETQRYSGGGSSGTEKQVYKTPYSLAYYCGTITKEPDIVAELGEDKNGKIVPYAFFNGGEMELSEEMLSIWRQHRGC